MSQNSYTPASKCYIYTCLFLEITLQLHQNIFLEIASQELHYKYSFVIQRTTPKSCLGTILLENLIAVTEKNVFRMNFAIISEWSWEAVDLGNCPKRESLQKWLGEGAKGLFDSSRPREQRSPKSLLHHPNPLLHRCNPISHQWRGLLLAGSKRPFAPSPNHFRELSVFGQFPRSADFPRLECKEDSILTRFRLRCGLFGPPEPQESPRETKPKKGPKRKVHEFRPVL